MIFVSVPADGEIACVIEWHAVSAPIKGEGVGSELKAVTLLGGACWEPVESDGSVNSDSMRFNF